MIGYSRIAFGSDDTGFRFGAVNATLTPAGNRAVPPKKCTSTVALPDTMVPVTGALLVAGKATARVSRVPDL